MSIGSLNFKIIKANDRQILDNLTLYLKETNSSVESMYANFLFGGQVALDKNYNNNTELDSALKSNSELIQSLTCNLASEKGSYTITISRTSESHKDNCVVNFTGIPSQNREFAFACTGRLRKIFKAIDSADFLKAIDESQNDFNARREESLNKLESVSVALINDQEKYRQNLEQQYEQRKKKLDEDHNQNLSALAQEKENLSRRIKEVDDRASMHARREHHKNFKQIFKDRSENFKISNGTIALRRPIEWFCWTLLAVFGSLFILTSLTSLKIIGTAQEAEMIGLYIKQASLGLLFTTVSIFYIRWRNHWFERHAQEEFFLKRFEIDLDRASWAVELASEWVQEKNKEIPESLLNRITINLFEQKTPQIPKLHPIEDLTSILLGASSRLNLKLGNGSEVELDRKSMDSLRKPN